jgi:hypothetical protein
VTSSKTKVIVALCGGLALTAVVGVIAYEFVSGPGGRRTVTVESANKHPALPATVAVKPEGEWMPQFKAAYGLADGQPLKLVARPFIPQRIDFYRAHEDAGVVREHPDGPEFYVIESDGNDFSVATAWWGQADLQAIITTLLRIERTALTGPPDLLAAPLVPPLMADLVVRKSATPRERADALAQILSRELKRKLTLTLSEVEREVIVVGGKFAYKTPPRGSPATRATTQAWKLRTPPRVILIYAGTPAGPGERRGGYQTSVTSDTFVRMLANLCRMPVIIEGTLGGERQYFAIDRSAYEPWDRLHPPDDATIDAILNNVAMQSELRLRRERRKMPSWVLAELPATQK